jgi:ABC-type transport system involved in multi-copper enzyme maturation permease subunit
MKFLAILKDSLRESIDAKVFYVMVGLSSLLIGVALTTTFTPTAGGEAVMKAAATPLSIDFTNLDLGDPQDDPAQVLAKLTRGMTDAYEVVEVTPADGAPDALTSTFKVRLRVRSLPPFLRGKADSPPPLEYIRERFGRLGDWQLAEVVDVKQVSGSGGVLGGLLGRGGEYEVTARPGPAALRLWPHELSLLFGAVPVVSTGVPLGLQLFVIEQGIVAGVGAWVTLVVSVIISAFFIPNMLRKGTVDFLLVKPIHRSTLLIYKYVGGLLFIALNTLLAVGGIWLALCLRSGLWSYGFLASIPTIIFFFAILYSISTLFAVLTRSAIVAILMTCAVWFGFWVVGAGHAIFEALREGDRITRPQALAGLGSIPATSMSGFGYGPLQAAAPLLAGRAGQLLDTRPYDRWYARIFSGLHYVLPRTGDLDSLNSQLSFRDLVFPVPISPRRSAAARVSWGETLTVSGAFIALMLGLSCWRFATRDY